jgi:hypothetical protein
MRSARTGNHSDSRSVSQVLAGTTRNELVADVLSCAQSFSYVFLPATEWHSCCDSLLASLRQDRSYRVVHDASGGTIFEAIG